MSFIKITGGGKITDADISNNIQIGGDNMIDIQSTIENANIQGNIHIASHQKFQKKWFEKPLGVALSLLVTVLGGGILYYFGWN